jgi:hypothetical protein
MQLVYTLTSGQIKSQESNCEIPFALVFLDNGIYRVETFFKDEDFFDKNKNSYFTIIGKTEKEYDIEIFGLSYTKYKYNSRKAELICHQHIKITDNRPNGYDKTQEEIELGDLIWFVELEGMKMKFANHTTTEKYRNTGKIDKINIPEFDHTSCTFQINHPDILGNTFELTFLENPKNGNILIDFASHREHNPFYFKYYLKIRNELLSFLSFINGGTVFIRKELTGISFNEKALDSQIVYHYSRKKKNDFHCNDYIPINEHHSYSSPIFNNLFLFCFDSFFQLNKTLEFNSLIFSLNNSTQTAGLEERYFILITAFEKICSDYSKLKDSDNKTLIAKDTFDKEIKQDLFDLLENKKSIIISENNSAFHTFKARIGGINKNNDDIVQRMYEFLDYAKIPVNELVKSLVEKERHEAVHEGIIGNTDEERIKNYWKLDHILRDSILNLIGYKSMRNRKVPYFRLEEMLHNETTKTQGNVIE